MTDTKPTIEEQIEWAERIASFSVSPLIPEAIHASLKELAAIKDAGDDVVEPPVQAEYDSYDGYVDALKDYIDTLLSAYKRVKMEKDLHYMKAEALHERAEKAEASNKRLVSAAEKARRNAEAVREGWRTGAITSCDGKSGMWSSENVDVEVALREALAKLENP